MSRYRRLRWANRAGVLAILAIMAILPVSVLYSLVFLGKLSGPSSELKDLFDLAGQHNLNPSQHWFWRGIQLLVLLSPLLLWRGWPLVGRLADNIGTINRIEGLRRRRRELIEAEKRIHADYSAAGQARESAKRDYPDHVSWPELEEDEAWGDDQLVADLLDPPEVILRYSRQSDPLPGELWLYDRKRIEAIKTDAEYMKRISEIRQRRWEEEARERWEGERARRQEEIDSVERAKLDERDQRQASQKIVFVA